MPLTRFGLIACSNVARRRFLPALRESTTARLEHIGSRDPAKAAQYAQEFSCAKHGSYEAVLSDAQVDAVYISTPPSLHEDWVLKAAASHKHILCEKPAFPSYHSAVKAVNCCRDAGVRLLEGYAFKYHPQHNLVRSLVADGRIGEPRFFQAEFTYPRPPENDIRLKPALNGGVFHDSAGYPVVAALSQMPGEPITVFCQKGSDPVSGVDDSFFLWLKFSGGQTAQLQVAFGVQYRSRYAITGTKGRIEVKRAFAVPPPMETIVAVETETGLEKISLEPVDQFRLMVDDFAAQIGGAAAMAKKMEADLLRQHAVMDAAARSNDERRVVDLSEYNL